MNIIGLSLYEKNGIKEIINMKNFNKYTILLLLM